MMIADKPNKPDANKLIKVQDFSKTYSLYALFLFSL